MNELILVFRFCMNRIDNMNPQDQINILRLNRNHLKKLLDVDKFVGKFMEFGVMSQTQRDHILSDPNSKADRFLDTVIDGGNKLYQTMCNILQENSNNVTYQSIMKILGVDNSQASGMFRFLLDLRIF